MTMAREHEADAPPDNPTVPTENGDTLRGVPTAPWGRVPDRDTVPSQNGDASPTVPTPASPIGDTVPTTVPTTGGDTVPTSPTVPTDPHREFLTDPAKTKKAKIQYAVRVLGTATRAPKPAEVADWLAGYDIEVTRSKVSPEVTAYKNEHGITSTGEFPVMTDERLAELDSDHRGDASPGRGDTVPDLPGDTVPTPADQGGQLAEEITETEEGRMDQGATSNGHRDPRTADLPRVPAEVAESFDTELASVLSTTNGNGRTIVPTPAPSRDRFQGWGHPHGDASPTVPVSPVPEGDTGASVPTGYAGTEGDTVPTSPTVPDIGDGLTSVHSSVPMGDGDDWVDGWSGVPTSTVPVPDTVHDTNGDASLRGGDARHGVPTAASPTVPTQAWVSPEPGTPEEGDAVGTGEGTSKRKAPAGEFGFYLASAVAMITSLDTSWRLFSDTLGVSNPVELVAMFAGLEISFVACAYHMGMSIRRRKEEPIPFVKTALWVLMCIAAVGAWINAGPLLGTARIAAGPGLAMLMLHLALSTERQANSSQRGTLAKIGSELRERFLSRLGLGNDDRDAAQRSRDRAAQRAAKLNAAPFAFLRTTRVRRAMRAARVSSDPAMMDKMLAEYDIEKHATSMRTLKRPNPFAKFDQPRS
ncbi:hypothetical protein D7D52_36000 [Nocardia yunnanensis]|uniref:DUF2637 domain-containing protein n=1 Tax=Nocardia yunnanensis TaxID=2382165 RepID=A0A386ZM10_9NOCA|nr:hypothetical protein [Nocardia yunnanensis]AYF78343.1 hypothetical protein D7D52_36000 [Nocardia yunnanensis]